MRWRMELYHERRRVLVCYDLEAPSPAAAVVSIGSSAGKSELARAGRVRQRV
jgi:hypothetical protein